ncbi:MICAL-like protein 2 Junctional Rab13-binding protein Molecule interacting with CasL-like 2 [Larimichthys crocea]|uniref:MICAL-like protein 2 Junctional Rab13-binding protein Molecule interacting with CasL-like 2 n=1 Tax=Larimichthys crocea TaxID=215358 RepID=A0A6G0HWB0_LARCR|nr:MICAL-like protein 2 Junctional Rab13-binding protein Molecule interacting with CasL-like 2 [Larimichthys crocea]
MAAIKALEQWCKMHCEGYRDVAITNMTTSFKNGMAFCALIHKYRPDLIDYDSLRKEDVFENNSLAFQVAEEKLGIPALLDAEDMVALRIPDRLSILTYVSQYYNYFKGRPPMGGVKRPAEGSKEEPSEKKNLPVVAKTFVSKTAVENRLPSTLTAQSSPKLARAAVQKAVLAENANKTGTLNSKCVSCKSHVHLVQRHFVEGKLYHRSCFKCSECSSVLHAGGYKPGKDPDTFICNANQNSCKPSPSEPQIKKGPASSAGRLNSASQSKPAPHSTSVLSAPLNIVVKPVSPTPPSKSWTASAQKTQSARQRFFQAAPPVTEASTGNRKPAELSSVLGRQKVPLSPDDEKSRGRTTIGKKLAEENCNNNNKRPFTIRSAEGRFGDEPSSADRPYLRKDKCSQGPAGNWAVQPSTSQTNNKESPCLKAINKDNTRPTTVHKTAKDPIYEGQSKLEPLKTEPGLKDAEADAFTEQHKPGFVSATSSNISTTATRPPSTPTPAVPPVSLPLFDPAQFRVVSPKKPQSGSEDQGFKHRSHSSVKSPPRRPAVESISTSTTAPANHGNPSGAKKGKYLSPTNASRTEMRSPSVKSYHIPVEQIERELNDIETNLAQLEKEGVELEKKLRSCEEEGEGDILMDPLMVDWFNLIRKKQMYIRKESELVYTARTQELEQQQPDVEGELRRLLEKPDHLKSREERQREKKLMQRLMEIVDGRNAIVEGLDEDRLREVEEDQQLNEMMKNLGVKKAKNKRKSSISKLFRRRSKRRVE